MQIAEITTTFRHKKVDGTTDRIFDLAATTICSYSFKLLLLQVVVAAITWKGVLFTLDGQHQKLHREISRSEKQRKKDVT